MAFNPWFKANLRYRDAVGSLTYSIPFDVFSTMRIDEGTELLLAHLPNSQPGNILDMGCGYGALGLPVAMRNPNAQVEMVDRDLLAVEWAEKNAKANGLKNCNIHGSLGYRDCKEQNYDWILCNVPARIGRPFIRDLFETGLGLLRPGGEVRVVVIRDLVPLLREVAAEAHLPLSEIAVGPRHAVWACRMATPIHKTVPDGTLYLRDTVMLAGLSLSRPFDLGGDDPKRLNSALPILLDVLPKAGTPKAPKSVFVFRCGYGQLPCVARSRWPGCDVTAQDRDLLGTEFTRRNAEDLQLNGDGFRVAECVDVLNAMDGKTYDLVMGEISPSAGELVAVHEIQSALKALSATGQAYFLALEKLDREWIQPWVAKTRAPISRVLSREGYVLLRGSR